MSRLLTWMLQTPCNCNSKDSQRVVLRFAAAALANRMKSFSSASGASFSVNRARLGSSPEEASARAACNSNSSGQQEESQVQEPPIVARA